MSKLNKILSSFQKTIDKLRTHAEQCDESADKNYLRAGQLQLEADDLVVESEKAEDIANKLEDLIS